MPNFIEIEETVCGWTDKRMAWLSKSRPKNQSLVAMAMSRKKLLLFWPAVYWVWTVWCTKCLYTPVVSALFVACSGIWRDRQRDWRTWPSCAYYSSHLCHTSAQLGVCVRCKVRVCEVSCEVCHEPRSISTFAVCCWAHQMWPTTNRSYECIRPVASDVVVNTGLWLRPWLSYSATKLAEKFLSLHHTIMYVRNQLCKVVNHRRIFTSVLV